MKKAIQKTDIPVKNLKDIKDFIAGCFMIFTDALKSSKFPSSLKMANMKAVVMKGTKSLKQNYKPISILPLISKIFGRTVCKQFTNFF